MTPAAIQLNFFQVCVPKPSLASDRLTFYPYVLIASSLCLLVTLVVYIKVIFVFTKHCFTESLTERSLNFSVIQRRIQRPFSAKVFSDDKDHCPQVRQAAGQEETLPLPDAPHDLLSPHRLRRSHHQSTAVVHRSGSGVLCVLRYVDA